MCLIFKPAQLILSWFFERSYLTEVAYFYPYQVDFWVHSRLRPEETNWEKKIGGHQMLVALSFVSEHQIVHTLSYEENGTSSAGGPQFLSVTLTASLP